MRREKPDGTYKTSSKRRYWYKNQQANNRNFNDYSFGGDQSNSTQTPWRRVHRF